MNLVQIDTLTKSSVVTPGVESNRVVSLHQELAVVTELIVQASLGSVLVLFRSLAVGASFVVLTFVVALDELSLLGFRRHAKW